jgi:hypothetical protein
MQHPSVSTRDSLLKTQRDQFNPKRASPFLTGGAQSMRQDERKSLILGEWDRWLQTQSIDRQPTARDTLKFFYDLQDRQSPLLNFRPSGRDKWQVIHGWLVSAGSASD